MYFKKIMKNRQTWCEEIVNKQYCKKTILAEEEMLRKRGREKKVEKKENEE